MKFKLQKTSDLSGEHVFIELESIDQLLDLCKKEEYHLIIKEPFYDEFWSIEIYDDYRE